MSMNRSVRLLKKKKSSETETMFRMLETCSAQGFSAVKISAYSKFAKKKKQPQTKKNVHHINRSL